MKVYEFTTHHDFYEACKLAHGQKIKFKAYSPLPEDDVLELLDQNSHKVSYIAFSCAVVGCLSGFFLQYYANVYGYSMNVGGKPLNSWPAFMLITFELTILFCAFGILGSFLFLNKYPRFDRLIFELPEFNERRHEHFFISTDEEVKDVKAHELFHVSSPE